MSRKQRRFAVTAAVVLVLVIAAGITAFAEFTKSYRAKRVIAAIAPEGMLFSSNYLEPGNDIHYYTVNVSRSEASDPGRTYFDRTVTVSNFARGNESRYYNRDINYRLYADIVTVSTSPGGETVLTPVDQGSRPAVKINGGDMAAYYSGTLAAGAARTDEFVMSLPKTMLTGEKMYVQLTAAPVGGAYTDLGPITALFDLDYKAELTTVNWHIEPSDNRSNPVGEYSGYNFRLSGSGAGTVTLGWDAAKLEISDVFRQSVGAADASVPGCTGAITFSVDAATGKNSYDIQFYNASAGSVSSWSDVDVQMIFEEAAAP